MPVKRLFSTTWEDNISDILPTFGSSLSSDNLDSTVSDVSYVSWVHTDDEDSGLGPDDVFTDCDVSPPAAKKQKISTDVLAGDNILTADRSIPYSLPTVTGKHKDLKSITTETLSDVISGRYNNVISSYRVIDCRYPYEFDGGHIKGAQNRYLHSSILDLLKEPVVQNQVIIFHCEFSQERGPSMLRFLRSKDREMNSENYPALNFPEVYLVDGGYKAAYEAYPNMCDPTNYVPMIHSSFSSELRHCRQAADLRHFRKKSKSWSAGDGKRLSRKVIF